MPSCHDHAKQLQQQEEEEEEMDTTRIGLTMSMSMSSVSPLSFSSSLASSVADDDANPYSQALVPLIGGRPRFPFQSLQFFMDGDVGYSSSSSSNTDEGEREWEDADVDMYGVTCRALVLHPTKQNRNLHKPPPYRPAHHRATIDLLPRETLTLIFRFLPAQSLLASEVVCTLWREIASKDDHHWEELCKRTYGISPQNFTPPPDPVKLLYLLHSSSFAELKYGSGGGGKRGLRFLF